MAQCVKALASSKTDVLNPEPTQSRETTNFHRLSSASKAFHGMCVASQLPNHNVETYYEL